MIRAKYELFDLLVITAYGRSQSGKSVPLSVINSSINLVEIYKFCKKLRQLIKSNNTKDSTSIIFDCYNKDTEEDITRTLTFEKTGDIFQYFIITSDNSIETEVRIIDNMHILTFIDDLKSVMYEHIRLNV